MSQEKAGILNDNCPCRKIPKFVPFIFYWNSNHIGEINVGQPSTDSRAIKKCRYNQNFFTDLNGRVVSLTVNPENIVGIIENGVGFDGSSIAGYARVENSDRLLFPDPETFKLVPFANEVVGFFLGNIFNARGTRAPTDPRAALENVVS